MGHGEQDDEPRDEGYDEGSLDEHGDDEHAPKGAPPDPLDRVWMHPSELHAMAPGLTAKRPKRRSLRGLAVPVLAGAAGALITVGVLALAGAFSRTSSPASQQATQQSVAGDGEPSVPPAAARAGASVMSVVARDGAGTRHGSGVSIRHAGEVLTTARLIGDARVVDVLTADGQRHTARVLGRDRTTDLALISLDASADVPAADLADRAAVAGSDVWIVGAGNGTRTVWLSSGMVSTSDAILVDADGPMVSGLIETNAAASDAATGGALVDDRGAVVGIVLGRSNSATTYAAPIADAVEVAEELNTNGVATHGSAGFNGLDGPKGPTLGTINADGPAARAGARAGDVVVSLDGRPVESMSEVMALVRSDDPGQTVTVVLDRKGNEFAVRIELGSQKG
jgi:S1-C subfamily serine protease